jgi:hypothetical protein
MIMRSKLNCLGWHYAIGLQSRIWYERDATGWRRFEFGIFKLHTLPGDGEMITRKHYRGFWFQMRFWFPVVIEQWR